MCYRSRWTRPTALLFGLLGCRGTDPVSPPVQQQPVTATPPRVVSASLAPNPNSVLSAVVTFSAEEAESAQVIGNSGVAVSDTLPFSTPALPELLGRARIATTGVSSGLTLAALQIGGADVVAMAFDSAGTIRWYRRFAGSERVGGDLKQQPNGHFTLYRGESHGSQKVPGAYVEFTAAGDSIRAISVSPPRYVDNHELTITSGPDGTDRFHLFTYDYRPSDLRTRHGSPVELAGHQLVRLRSDGSTEFEWNGWDYFTLQDWIEPRPASMPEEYDFDHPNSIDFDQDGNYIVSFRRPSQVVKIDATTGAVIWRFGGRRGEFTVGGDPLGGFSNQHSVKVLPNGHLLLYDNGASHHPPESRAAEYALDPVAKTATLVWEYRHNPAIYTPGGGAVQRLENGNTFAAFGQAGRATEVRPDGSVAWEAEVTVDGKPAVLYRLVRIASLYRYENP
jgi:outer membrane protein assembly factor BamB